MVETTKSNAQVVSLEFYDGGGEILHCPVCGHALMVPDEEAVKCEHSLFVWIDLAGEYFEELTSPDIQKVLDDADDPLTPYDEAFQAECPPNTVIFSMTGNGIACGPVSSMVAVGVRFPG